MSNVPVQSPTDPITQLPNYPITRLPTDSMTHSTLFSPFSSLEPFCSLNRCRNNPTKFSVFRDYWLNSFSRQHRSLSNQVQPDRCLIEFFERYSQLVNEIATALCASRFAIVCGCCSSGSKQLTANVATLRSSGKSRS